MEEKLPIETNRDKFIHKSSYFKPFDVDGDGKCMYHALSIGMNKLDLDVCNNKWNQRALRNVIAEYFKEIHKIENHENNSVWKSIFAHISENENFFKTIKKEGEWGNESVLTFL